MLIIGRKKPKQGNDFGGVVILYELFLEYLTKRNIYFDDVDLNWRNYHSKIIFLMVIYPILTIKILASKHKSISFHGTTTDFTYYAPFVVLLCKIFSKRITLRKFGGTFDAYYDSLNFLGKALTYYAIKNSDYNFFETKYLVQRFKSINRNATWFPNVRERPSVKTDKIYNFKLVYLGQVRKEKGIRELLEASNILNSNYQVDIYGPIVDDFLLKAMEDSPVSYKGILQPYQVTKALSSYDLLVLPSYSEGYPGVIIEALSVGLPVVATELPSIKEIIENNINGILFKPKSAKALVNAIQKVNKKNYPYLSKEALIKFQKFDQDIVMERIIKYL